MNNFVRFACIFPIAETSGNSWVAILSNPALKKFCAVLLANSPRLIPDHDRAAFPIMSLCVPQILQLVLGQKQYVDVQRQLLEKTDTLLTTPPSVLLAKIYVKILAIRLEKAGSGERESMAMAAFQDWVENSMPHSDCYSLSEVIFDWCGTVMRLRGLTGLSPYLTGELFRRGTRFFPVFVAVSKFIRKLGGQAPETIADLKDDLAKTGAAMECQAHGIALRHVMDAKTRRVVLDLAACDVDSPESDALRAALGDSP
jgi:hypothetical protein